MAYIIGVRHSPVALTAVADNWLLVDVSVVALVSKATIARGSYVSDATLERTHTGMKDVLERTRKKHSVMDAGPANLSSVQRSSQKLKDFAAINIV